MKMTLFANCRGLKGERIYNNLPMEVKKDSIVFKLRI